jgi:hypothetical protein
VTSLDSACAVHGPGINNLVRVAGLGVDTYGLRQQDFSIGIFLDGARAALQRGNGYTGGS